MSFSDYIVYVDESGDHSLTHIDENYPVFVLAFCIFHKRYYSDTVVSALQKFKFKHFGHDIVVLHEHDIRKERGDFNLFRSGAEREAFLSELTDLIDQSNFILIACVIDKHKLRARGGDDADNPYHYALRYGLERLYGFLDEKGQSERVTHVVVECRGKKEDRDLELEFRRICDGANLLGRELPFRVKFADKRINSAGLQLSDLVARPIGLQVLRPEQPNRAFDVLRRKFYCGGGRQQVGENYEGLGLKRLPD
ncbi:DUF3800 domain-containing protein [Polycyclovorans algicola]|uniref:DUF3800 domain-containing protein n=1 Tax=Polycyclovorans algicola TaxID=616992 RepID=UPI0004A77701|nr:DUF3800 domain-containing protein [Polycyclovorans algicola]